MPKSYLNTSELCVGYDGKSILNHVNLEVSRGQILTLIGPNGSGKSTILKTIIGQLTPIAGTVFLDGGLIKQLTARQIAKKMAIVTTERIRPELMSCYDIVATGRYPYTGYLGLLSDEDRRIVDAALEKVNGTSIAQRPFDAVSDGQRQRILLARAICQQPEIIILDEPTSFLDIRYKLEILTILKQMVKADNLAVIVSLHELELAQRVSDRVVCVADSRIDRIGTPEEIFTREYIAKLYHMTPGRYDPCFDTLEYAP